MKLFTYHEEGDRKIGLACNERVFDPGPGFPSSMIELIEAGPSLMPNLKKRSLEIQTSPESFRSHSIGSLEILAPIPKPNKILCCGLNYWGHLEENPEATRPDEPFFFAKLPSAVVGPGSDIVFPSKDPKLDYEVELACVIGKRMRFAAETDAMDSVFGYTILHDVSARGVQFKDHQITLGKNFDTFAPMGPCIVTADEMEDLSDVRLSTSVNGKVMQDGSTRDWIFTLPQVLSALSEVMTLEPGDIVSTGTPKGVAHFTEGRPYLKVGDRVKLEIDGIGVLENQVAVERR